MAGAAKQPDEFDAVRTVVQTLESFPVEEQKRLLRWVQEKLGLASSTPAPVASSAAPSHQVTNPTPPAHSHHSHSATNIKTFIEAKHPKSENQLAAVVAYYYRFEAPEGEKKDAITKDDILEACRKAGVKRPNNPAQVLINAMTQGLIDKTDRGFYRINSVGENLVAIVLPNQDGGSASTTKRAKPKKATKKPGK